MKKGLIRIIAMLVVAAVLFTAFHLTAFAAESLKTPEVSVSTSTIEPTTSGVSRYNPTIKLLWKKVDGANRYYIYRRDTQKGKLTLIADTSKLYYKDKGLELDKTYYYKVIAYKITDGKVKAKSDCSSTVKTAVTALEVPNVTAFSKTDSSIEISINEVKGATRYYIYFSTSKTDGYQCIGYTTNSAYTLTNLENSTNCYFKVRAAKEIDGKVYKSEYSDAIICKTKDQSDGLTYINGILIVNKTYPLPSSYDPGGLTKDTYDAFQELVKGAAKDGINIYLSSGFRSYSHQTKIYNEYVYYYGQENADMFSARPGHSEHQAGIAIDVNIFDDSFIGTPEAIWLEKHCNEYGFIIRYPQDKQDITGYQYEPWHIRYVGKETAQAIREAANNAGDPYLTLEEYLSIDSYYH